MNNQQFNKFFSFTIWVILGTLLLSSVLLHARLIANLDFEGENLLGEGGSLYALRNASSGQPLYRDFSVPPHTLTPYMPFFYFVPGFIARALRLDWLQMVLLGRSYVYACWLGIGLLIYWLARQANCARLSAGLAAFLWAAGQLAFQWANSYRPDAVALASSLGAIWMYQRGKQVGYMFGALSLLVLAFMNKQSSVAALAAITLAECIERRFTRALLLAGGWTIVTMLILAVGQLLTGGFFIINLSRLLTVLTGPRQAFTLFAGSIFLGATGFTGGALACVICRSRMHIVWTFYFLIALSLAFEGSLITGATVNYYLEPFAVACVLTAVLVNDWQSEHLSAADSLVRLGWLGLALGSAVNVLVIRAIQLPQWLSDVVDHRGVRARQNRSWNEMLKKLDSLREPILIEDSYLGARREAVPFMLQAGCFADLQRDGKFDDSNLLRRIESVQFRAIVARFPVDAVVPDRGFARSWTQAIYEHYELADACANARHDVLLYLYRPRQETAPSPMHRR